AGPRRRPGRGPAGRPAAPSDFMIVTRNRARLSAYARKLEACGVPHQVTGGSALNEIGELRLLYACLKAAIWPDDPVALLAVLRSELFGVSDADLYAFRKAGGRFSWQTQVPEELRETASDEALRSFQDAFARLKKYGRWLARLPPVCAVEKIAADLGLPALAASRPGGGVEAGSLAKAIEILRGLRGQMWTNVQLVECLGALLERDPCYDGISARSEEGNVVRIMNLHKVKGLEAPVVFLADPSGEWDHPAELHVDRSGDRIAGYMAVLGEKKGNRPQSVLAQPEGWDRLAEKEKRFAEAEALRLRYVAATRAGSAVIITQKTGKKNANQYNPWKYFAGLLPAEAEIPDPGPPGGPAAPPEGEISCDEVSAAEEAIAGRVAACSAPTCALRRVKEYASEMAAAAVPVPGGGPAPAARPASSEVPDGSPDSPPLRPGSPCAAPAGAPAVLCGAQHEDGDSGAEATRPEGVQRRVEDPSFPDGEHGIEWGTALHSLLDLAAQRPAAGLLGPAEAALAEQGLDVGLAQQAVEQVRAVLSSPLWQRALRSRKRLTEVPFEVLAEGEGEPLPTLLRGAIDLVFLEEDGWVIVDYKTDLVRGRSPERLVREYAPQVRLYAEAWERSTGEPVREAALYFLREGLYLPVGGRSSDG
ncbi:MAG: PD-(D/E)XK nuclease family protein, partial [bacterium]